EEAPLSDSVLDGSFDHGSAPVLVWTAPAIGRAGPAEAHIQDLGTVVSRVADAARHHIVGSGMGGAEYVVPHFVDDLHGHQLHVERDAGRADIVVRRLPDGAAHVRAVTMEIDGKVVVPDEVGR